jgi:hypothetical protein
MSAGSAQVWRRRAPLRRLTLTVRGFRLRFCATRYCPVPVTVKVCTPGFPPSVSVIALARVPTALGVNVTVMVHFA